MNASGVFLLIGCGIFEISPKAAEINKHAKQSRRGQNGVTAVSEECNCPPVKQSTAIAAANR